jgi:hypothetical protein
MSTLACGSWGESAVAGAAGVDNPGMDESPGMDDSPGIIPGRPDADGSAEAPGSAEAAGNGEAADGTPGKVRPGEAGAAGGVAPSAVARLCRI